MLHRPGNELKRLTPTNKDSLLFDDVLWVKRARQEHDAFADTLVEAGVEVLYLHQLLAETLESTPIRAGFINTILNAAAHGTHLTKHLNRWLAELWTRRSDRGGDLRSHVRRAAAVGYLAGGPGRCRR